MSHVDHVAEVHILALDPEIKGNKNIGAISGGVSGNEGADSIEIIKKHFAEAVKVFLRTAHSLPKLLIDTSNTDGILRIKQRNDEDTVVSVTERYLEVLERRVGRLRFWLMITFERS